HAGIDDRDSGAALAPGLEVPFVARPAQAVCFGLEGLVHADAREGDEDVAVEVAPGELGEPDGGAVLAPKFASVGFDGGGGALADRDCADGEVRGKCAGAVDRRVVAVVGVACDLLGNERPEPATRLGLACREEIGRCRRVRLESRYGLWNVRRG